jgi:DNA/RNA-binding domain of Phe-tRNA-synthetase-like protein
VILISKAFQSTFPGARLGLLAMGGVANPASHPRLEQRKAQVEEELRRRYQGYDRGRLRELPFVRPYDVHYRKFAKTYHLLLQLESVLGGKPIPSVAALVEAMFMAEVNSALLTAGHDLDALSQPLTLTVSDGDETYLGIRGRKETCKRGDMMIVDSEGVISSVLGGPDARTRITPRTRNVLFTVYAPEGIGEEMIRAHLRELEEHVRLISPEAVTQTSQVL